MTTTAPATITVAPAVGRLVPSTLGPGVLLEDHDSGFIEDDLQTGTITERWIIQGNPWEARESPGMQNFQIKSIHAWFGNHANNEFAYLIKRRFEHKAKSESSDERMTLATFTWKIRPCPHEYEDEMVGTLISYITWWSRDSPPRLLAGGQVGLPIMFPSRLLIRRYPAVRLNAISLDRIMGELGKTNELPFKGLSWRMWLFQNVRYKMLHGNPFTGEGTYELTLYFLGDPARRHELWRPTEDDAGNLLRPDSGSDIDLVAVHDQTTVYPQSTIPFDDIVQVYDTAQCDPPPPP